MIGSAVAVVRCREVVLLKRMLADSREQEAVIGSLLGRSVRIGSAVAGVCCVLQGGGAAEVHAGRCQGRQ
jgi:hypothetical protein